MNNTDTAHYWRLKSHNQKLRIRRSMARNQGKHREAEYLNQMIKANARKTYELKNQEGNTNGN